MESQLRVHFHGSAAEHGRNQVHSKITCLFFFCGGELTTFQLSWWGGHILPSYLQGILWIEEESPGIESALLNALPPNVGRVHF